MKKDNRGGKRPGSGQPKKPYKSTTMRIPFACVPVVKAIVKRYKDGKLKIRNIIT